MRKILNATLIFLCALTLVVSVKESDASTTTIDESAGFWGQAVGEGNLSAINENLSSVRLWVEGQGRFSNANPDSNMNWYQSIARTGLGYAVTDRLTFWLGYTYSPIKNYNKPFVAEQDFWPAVRYVFPTSIGTITLREWIEFRYAGGDTPGIRPRTLIRLLHPFSFEPRLGLVIWDEFFFNANNVQDLKTLGLSGFNQNRAFLGLAWTFTEKIRGELGYMNYTSNTSKEFDPNQQYKMINNIMGVVFFAW